jgi:hypothetical protein
MALRTRTYILERTRDLFAGQADEPSSGAARLVPTNSGGYPTSIRRPNGGAALPWLPGSCPSDLRHGRSRSLAPARSEGNLYVWGHAAPDNQ